MQNFNHLSNWIAMPWLGNIVQSWVKCIGFGHDHFVEVLSLRTCIFSSPILLPKNLSGEHVYFVCMVWYLATTRSTIIASLEESSFFIFCKREKFCGGRDFQCLCHSLLLFSPRQTEPYLTLRPVSTNGQPPVGNNKFEGYCADLAKKIADIVGYDYVIRPVKDGKYGSKDENGTWNGMVGELVRNVSVVCGLIIRKWLELLPPNARIVPRRWHAWIPHR